MSTISLFKNVTSNVPDAVSFGSFFDLCSGFEELSSNPISNKADNALWSAAVYRSGSIRRNTNVVGSTIFALDADAPGNDIFTTLHQIDLAGVERFAHTSHSHTDEHHKYRVIFNLTREIKSDGEYKALYAAACRWLDATIWDPACKDFSRMFYLPCSSPHYGQADTYHPPRNSNPLDPDILLTLYPEPTKEVIKPSEKLLAIGKQLKQDIESASKKVKLYHNHIFDSTLIKKSWVDEYWGETNNWHFKLYQILCKIAIRAKHFNFDLDAVLLGCIAAEIDRADAGGPYYSTTKYSVEANCALKFAAGVK